MPSENAVHRIECGLRHRTLRIVTQEGTTHQLPGFTLTGVVDADEDHFSLTEVAANVEVTDNIALPDCEVCDFLDQLSSVPDVIDVHDNVSDSCTPVPDNCP